MRFLIDAQLPPALCGWFEEKGFDAAHVMLVVGGQAPDRAIAAYAADGGWTLVTKDDDFSFRFYQLVWLRCGNITNAALRLWLDRRWTMVLARLEAGDALVEVR